MFHWKYLLGILGLFILIGGLLFFSLTNEWNPEQNTFLPQPLADYIDNQTCGDALCESTENATNCALDCPAVKLRTDQWTQVNGPYGGLITDAEKSGDVLWLATSYTQADLGSNGVYTATLDGVWELIGGTHKNMLDIAVDATDPNHIAFVAQGELQETYDRGTTWENIDLEVETYDAVAMSQANSTLLFAGARVAGKALLFISEDDGKTWAQQSTLPDTDWSIKPIWAGIGDEAKNEIQVITPHPMDENIIFVGTNTALFKSEDKGKAWQRIDADFHRSDILNIDISPQRQDEIYVRVGVFEELTCIGISNITNRADKEQQEKENCAGIYKSTDGGKTWQQLNAHYTDPSEGGVFVDDYDPDTAYAVFSRKILKTTDGGKNWQDFFWTHNEPFIPNVGIERLLFGEDSAEIFLAGRGGLWHTPDNGKHWHEHNQGFIGSEVVDILRATDGTLYAGTLSLGMFKSTDGGMNWTFASYKLENPYIMLMALHPTDPQTVFITTNGGVYVSYDGAQTWERVAEEFFLGGEGLLPDVAHFHGIAFDPTNPDRIYVGGGGDQWSPQGAGMSISADGGKTWQHANIGFATNVHVSRIIVDKNNPATIYTTTQGPTDFATKMGNGQGVYKSLDYGQTWQQINAGLETTETNTIALDPNNANVLYLGTDDDGIYKTTNAGESWNRVIIPQLPEQYGVGDIIVDPRNGNMVYVATIDYYRLATSRGTIGDHGVFVSKDGGATWESFSEGLNHQGAFSIELDAERDILYVGTRGGGIYWRSVK